MADSISSVSGSSSPYTTSTYSPGTTDKNTLTTEGYFKLLATQLANQDMTSPMDNSELMAQMTNMMMIQSLATLQTNMQSSMAMSKTSYAASLMGKEVSVKVSDEDLRDLDPSDNGVRYGKIESVNLTGDEPTFRLEGDSTDYPLENLLSIGADVTGVAERAADGSSSSVDLSGD